MGAGDDVDPRVGSTGAQHDLAGLEGVRLLTDVYQDTTLEPWTKTFLERRAERAVSFGIVNERTAARWLDGFTEVVARGAFVLTLNYYGAVGTKPI